MLPRTIPDGVYRLFIESVEDYALFLIDLDGRVASWNAGAERIKEWRAEEIIGQHYGILFTPGQRESGDPERQLRLAARDGVFSDEAWRARKGNINFWASVTLTALRDDAGELLGFAKVTRDLSSRKRAEEERALLDAQLRVQERRMRLLVDGMRDYAILSLDADGLVSSWNAGAELLFGWTADDVLGRPLEPLELDDEVREDGAGAAEGHGGEEGWWTRKDGSRARVSRSVSELEYPDGGLAGHLVVMRDLTDERRVRDELVRLASTDALTGLANRRRFDEELERALRVARRSGDPFGVLVVDLDDFKAVNDEHGHGVGDELLIGVSGVLRRRLRDVDVVARLGGDEFGVLLAPPTSAERARQVADGLRERIGAHAVPSLAPVAPVTASIGVTVHEPGTDDAATAGDLLSRADAAMYEAKGAGRGLARVFAPATRTRPEALIAVGEQLRRALEGDGLTLFAQPMRSLRGSDDHFELLVRMLAEGGRVLAPDGFLPHAQTLGLMGRLDRWVVNAALELAVEHPGARLTVNVSAAALQDRSLVEFIEAQVRAAGIDPSRLMFEITETEAIANLDRAIEFAGRLARLGCRFALDDFGTGFGSYLHLTRLPVDVVKIDGRFVRRLPHSPVDQAVVETMTALSHRLEKLVVAEQVEDRRTVELLTGYGVDYAQGHFYAHPAPAREVLGATSPPG